MLDRIRKAREAESGFTLIELLLVIVILGVLGGIVLFGVATFQGDSEAAACKADSDTAKVAAQAYKAKHGTGAATMAVLVSEGYLQSTPDARVTISAVGVVSDTCPA